MDVRPIRNRRDHANVLDEIERLMGSRKGSPAAEKLEVLAALVAAWEDRHDTIEAPDPIEAIRAHMTDSGLAQADFARMLGARSLSRRISSIAGAHCRWARSARSALPGTFRPMS